MNIKAIFAALVTLMGVAFCYSSASAQQGFRPTSNTSTSTISVTTSTSTPVTGGSALLALVCNIGSAEAFVAIGNSGVTATASAMSFPAGFCTYLQLNGGNYLAAITASSTTTLRVTYGSGVVPMAGAGSGGGGGGGGAVTIADGADVTQGAESDTAWSGSGSGTVVAILKSIYNAIIGSIPAGTNTIGTVGQLPYPVGATPITASATGTTAATTATLAGTSGKTTYICGYSIRANATAATTVTNTVTGVITATLSSIMWVAPLASGIGIDEQIFSPCIPASATNTGIAIVSGAPGSGGTVSSKGWGYQL